MPELNNSDSRTTSFFEFWPTQLIYLPVVLQWILLSFRYRSLSLPLIANTSIPLAGMVGESKACVLQLAGDIATPYIAPFICLTKNTLPVENQLNSALSKMQSASMNFPVIAKPDIGCRGVGVKIITDAEILKEYLYSFPQETVFLLQKKIEYEAEAGIFYIRHPGQAQGTISSITLKYSPYVTGDGEKTLRQLIEQDPRASKISDIYLSRHQSKLNEVIPDNMAFRLSFAGSHSKGSIFRNGNCFITDDLIRVFDKISTDIEGFFYGRFDVRFECTEKLIQGKNFYILEINGASSEATHIWDRNTSLAEVYKTLFYQYRTLFQIGHINRKKGHTTPSLWRLLKAWRHESRLVKQYPETD